MNRLQQLRVSALALLAVTTITFCAVFLRDTLTLANFTMIYLLLVVIVAIHAGTAPAFLTAFASFMAINFFLVPPFYSLLVLTREKCWICSYSWSSPASLDG